MAVPRRPAATWFGKGAALKGLRDPVDPACLLPLLAGQLDERTLLGRSKGDNRTHRPGWELMFSAPKSVSLMALAGGDELLLAAHDRAVQEALTWLETEVPAPACAPAANAASSDRLLARGHRSA